MDTSKMITITVRIAVKDRVFLPNTQWCYTEEKVLTTGCGCNGTKKSELNYVLLIDGVTYEIPSSYAVKSDVLIACEDSDAVKKKLDIGEIQVIKNFDSYVNKPNPNEIAASANIVRM